MGWAGLLAWFGAMDLGAFGILERLGHPIGVVLHRNRSLFRKGEEEPLHSRKGKVPFSRMIDSFRVGDACLIGDKPN